jgi:hypothetical protein
MDDALRALAAAVSFQIWHPASLRCCTIAANLFASEQFARFVG